MRKHAPFATTLSQYSFALSYKFDDDLTDLPAGAGPTALQCLLAIGAMA